MVTDEQVESYSNMMKEFTLKLKEKGAEEILECIKTSLDYHHKATNLHARLIVMQDLPKNGFRLWIQSNTLNEQPKVFCERFIGYEDLIKYSIREIMDSFFAKHVLNFILSGTTAEDSIQKVMESLYGHKKYS